MSKGCGKLDESGAAEIRSDGTYPVKLNKIINLFQSLPDDLLRAHPHQKHLQSVPGSTTDGPSGVTIPTSFSRVCAYSPRCADAAERSLQKNLTHRLRSNRDRAGLRI